MDFRKAILEADDLPLQPIEIPEWKYTDDDGKECCTYWLRPITAAERDSFEQEMVATRGPDKQTNLRNYRARLAVRSLVDPNTKARLFKDGEAEVLGAKAAVALSRVADAAHDLGWLTDDDVEELGKNSESDQSEGSTSDSPQFLDAR